MSDPPADTKPVEAQPLGFRIKVIKPSGLPIEGVKVEIDWDFKNHFEGVDDVQVVQTGADGFADVPARDPEKWLSSTELTGTLRVSKRHHGPIVGDGETFENKPAKVKVKYDPNGVEAKVQLLGLPVATRVLWGRPRVIGSVRNVVEVMLMEGGTLGDPHTAILTRRLSSVSASSAHPTQIDEVLLFHIAHGELALSSDTDYQVTHDPNIGDFERCVPGKCKVSLPPHTPAKPGEVAKVSARAAVVGGLRMAHVETFTETSIKLTGPGDPENLNPRLMAGTVRLCHGLSTGSLGGLPIRTFITVGFGRPNEDRAHGNGRGVDFSGASTAHMEGLVEPEAPANPKKPKTPPEPTTANTDPLDPNCSWPKKGRQNVTLTVKSVVEQDFVVFFHWGKVKRLVLKADGVTKERRNAFDSRTYQDQRKPNQSTEKLLYALSELPSFDDRPKGHKFEDAPEAGKRHYEKAGVLFRSIYQFFYREFSQHDTVLGPLAPRPTPGSPPRPLDQHWADDTASTFPEPGEVRGQTIHPDYPEPDGVDENGNKEKRRESHLNHIHANVGSMTAKFPTFER